MENNSSDKSNKFGFNVSNADKDKQTEASSISAVVNDVKNTANTAANKNAGIDPSLEEEYTDHRTVTISLVRNYSLYRKVNAKVLPKRKDYIGSSVSASRTLSANKEEIEAYFPNLIGLAPNNENFITRVKQYLNNIRIPVDELGKTFDISFYYRRKKDYLKIKAEEEAIERTYENANRKSLKKLREALNQKIVNINLLESTKFRYGYPLNVDDYLMYRHCLLYKDVAKDVALINAEANIRFYFKDDRKEAERLKKYRLEVNKAKANYVACLADYSLFDAIYTQYCVLNNRPVLASLAEDRLDREIKLDKFSTDEPIKFNKMFGNKDIKLIATIENLIARGELIRSQYNQNITTPEGDFIGANMNEAVAWFKNVENRSIVEALNNKLKNI